MATIPLKFLAPSAPNIVALHIYEAATKDGPFNEIERTTNIGTSPNYITFYETTQAVSVSDWFTIGWEDSGGVIGDPSAAVQGGSDTLVGMVLARMQLRDKTMDATVAEQEAEAAISDYYGVIDPFSIDPTNVSPKILSGLTNLALARSYITKTITSTQANKWVAGIVSMDTSQGQAQRTTETIRALLDLANRDLGRDYSVILLLKEVAVADGVKQLVAADLSRSIIEIQ